LHATEDRIQDEIFDLIERQVDEQKLIEAYKEGIQDFFTNLRNKRRSYLSKHPMYRQFLTQGHKEYRQGENIAKFNVKAQLGKLLHEKFGEEAFEKVESVGTFINPSLEKIIALKPDLVIESFHSSDAIDKSLSSNNIEIIKIQANSIEDIFKNFQKVAKILGKEKEAEKIIAEKRQKIEEIKKIDTTEKKGLFILAPTPMRVFGKGTLPNDIMEMLNIKNIAAGMEGMSPTLTPEYIIKENPDIILTFVKDPQEIVKANPQIKDISAIKNNKFVVLETGQILRGSPRMIDYIADVYQKTK